MLQHRAILILIHEYAAVGRFQNAFDGTSADQLGGGGVYRVPFVLGSRLNAFEAGPLRK